MVDVYHAFSRALLLTSGPLTLLTIVMMFISVYRSTGKPPHVAGIVFTYARASLAKRGHLGVLTYLLIVSGLFFIVSMFGLLVLEIIK